MFLLIGRTFAALTVSVLVTVLVAPEAWLIRSLMWMAPARPKLDSISEVPEPQVALKRPRTTPGPVSVQV